MRRSLRLAYGSCLALLLAAGAYAQAVRDPMRPPGTATVTSRPRAITTLKLEGVISGAQRVAIVNGRLVRAGDEVAGARILEVLNDGVRYSRAGQVQSLLLPGVRALGTVRVASSPEARKP
jgi:MSHA biogenesis protein MshK